MAQGRIDQMEQQIHKILEQPYTRILIPDPNGFSAEILEFPGCFATGNTADEAYRNLEEAAASWLATELAKGASIPAPLKHYEASGRYLLRLPRSVHAQAAVVAAMEGVSLNQYISTAVAERNAASIARVQIAQAPMRAVLRPVTVNLPPQDFAEPRRRFTDVLATKTKAATYGQESVMQ